MPDVHAGRTQVQWLLIVVRAIVRNMKEGRDAEQAHDHDR
jgi:hypothetical protein